MRPIARVSAATVAAAALFAAVATTATGQPAAAKAKVHTYQLDGKPDGGVPGKIRIFMHVKKNAAGKWVPKYVGAMFAYKLTATCADGPLPGTQFSTQNDFDVKSGKFTYNFSSFKAQFKGEVSDRGKHVDGTFSFGPATVGQHSDCVVPGSPVGYTADYTKTTD
jgi:hypothetical protein